LNPIIKVGVKLQIKLVWKPDILDQVGLILLLFSVWIKQMQKSIK